MENNVADEVLEKLCKNGVIVYDKLPKDWKIIKDATTNPKGCAIRSRMKSTCAQLNK